MNIKTSPKLLQAVGLISGGLDSALAVKIVQDLGVRVHAMHFVLPWLTKPNPEVVKLAEDFQVPLEISFCSSEFLAMVKDPEHGYGVAMNPCIDCHIYQLRKAREFMEKIGAQFVFTGEVLGQRPMSQNRPQLFNIEDKSGLRGKLLRPLSAKLLDPMILEQEGVIDREKLFDFSGRSRSGLLRLAQQYGIKSYIPTGGGCLLTDKNFARRLADLFQHGYRDQTDIVLLSVGRHFRLNDRCKVIVGRDDGENHFLVDHAKADDYIFRLKNDLPGPTLLLQGEDCSDEILQACADIVKYFSKFRDEKDTQVVFCPAQNAPCAKILLSRQTTLPEIERFRI